MRGLRGLIHSPVLRVFLGDGLAKVSLFIANILLVRELSIAEYSAFSILSGAIFLGYQLACSPIERLYIAEHQRFRFVAKPLLVAFSVLAAFFSYFVIAKQHEIVSLAVVLVGVVLLALYQFFRIQLQQRQWFLLFSVAELLKNILWLALLLLFLYVAFEEVYSGIVSVALLILAALVSLLIISPFAGLKVEDESRRALSLAGVWRLLGEGKFVFGYSIVAAVHPYIPFALVAHYSGDQVIGSYGAAMRYIGIISMAGAAINVVFLPHMAKMKSTPDALNDFVISFVKRFILFAPALLVFALIVSWLITFVDDGKYPSLPYVFMAFSFLQVISIFSAPFINLLLIHRRSRVVFLIMISGVIASLVSALPLQVFIPDFAPVIGTCLGYMVISALSVISSQGSIGKSDSI